MQTSAVILAGGLGTRSSNPELPKILQIVGGKSLLYRHLLLMSNCEVGEVIILAGFKYSLVNDEVNNLKATFPDLEIKCVEDKELNGTYSALFRYQHHYSNDALLIILGDILNNFDVSTFLDSWELSGLDMASIVHPNNHPKDSDNLYVNSEGKAVFHPRNSLTKEFARNSAVAGVFAVYKHSLPFSVKILDIGRDLVEFMVKENQLLVFNDSHYFKDTGTPERLNLVEKEIEYGVFLRRGRPQGRIGIFLDRDGVIFPNDPPVYSYLNVSIETSVVEAIHDANVLGIPLFVVTNQPSIAKGFQSFSDHDKVLSKIDEVLFLGGAYIDEYLFCPHHPERGFEGENIELKVICQCRKPSIGMAISISKRHSIDLSRSIMIGDTFRDREFAQNSGMKFLHVIADGCEDNCYENCFASTHIAIKAAIEFAL